MKHKTVPWGLAWLGGLAMLLVALALLAIALFNGAVQAQSGDSRYYDMGQPTLTDLYVSPTGSDANSGATITAPLQTLTAAWNHTPMTMTTTGYRINLLPGIYPCEPGPDEAANCINFFGNRFGTFQYPIIVRAVGGTATIRGGLDLANVRYLYLLDLNLVGGTPLPTNSSGNNLLHLANGDHVLLHGLSVTGPACDNDTCNNLQEVLKVNQTQYLYVEDSTIGGAWHSSVDYMVVQYGHFLNNRVHTAGQWGMYIKGGSAYLSIEGNEFYGSQLGFQAGQSANLAMMRSPWLHYEAYDIKFTNNVLHDIPGVPMGVSGGYNILFAYNTLYRVGTSTGDGYELMHSVQGERNCTATDELPTPAPTCAAFTTLGGWGPNSQTDSLAGIPDRKVYVYNNIFYNPPPSQTLYAHLGILGPIAPPAGFQNAPSPSRTDDNLVIAGNIIWNGPAGHPLGVEDPGQGCQPANPTCNATRLLLSNTVNTIQPQLVNPAGGDFRPVAGGNVFTITTYSIPDFTWDDAPVRPAVPTGTLTNTVAYDRAGNRHTGSGPPGAYAGSAFTATRGIYLPLILRAGSARHTAAPAS